MTASQRKAYARQRRTAADEKDRESMNRREKRRLARLVVSAAILLLAVLLKLFWPSLILAVREDISPALSASMDVREVFSAVGRAVSGEGDAVESWREVARAVFNPAYESVETAAGADGVPAGETEQADSLLCRFGTEELPGNVCMTQRVLGFSYLSPVVGTLTSRFGERESPLDSEAEFHYGVDLAAEEGTAVACFADGTVRAAAESSSLGNYLVVDHAGGFATLYAHCSHLAVTAGQSVRKGQTIAEVGQTGDATGPHLHFELLYGSTYLNPIYYVRVM